MSGTTPALDAATERRIEESLERRQRPLERREILLALPFVAAWVVAEGIQFSSGSGWAVPTQLVLVPMLLLVPTPLVPLLAGGAMVLASLRDTARAGIAAERSLFALSDAWFVLAPAVVLVALGAQLPDLAHWPAYVAALGAQLAVNSALFAARAYLGGVDAPVAELMR